MGHVISAIRGQAIMDGDAGEVGEHAASVHGFLTAARSEMVERGLVGAGNMNPPQFSCDASAGLIEVRDRRVLEPTAC